MGTLGREEISRRITSDRIILNARTTADSSIDLEPASYDLMCGVVVWRDADHKDTKGEVRKEFFKPGAPRQDQPSVTIQPGEMVFVITHEEIQMPKDLCGTVLSRNKLAREGILALNAGHVDPGFRGPIVIRLISLRATPWVLTLGEPIFTVVFHTIESSPNQTLDGHAPISKEKTLSRVEEMAGSSLSNALFDLYARNLEIGLYKHYSSVLSDLKGELGKDFLKKDDFSSTAWKWLGVKVLALLGIIGTIATLIVRWKTISGWFKP
jgi:deoxycytidine triphosphate deaminase